MFFDPLNAKPPAGIYYNRDVLTSSGSVVSLALPWEIWEFLKKLHKDGFDVQRFIVSADRNRAHYPLRLVLWAWVNNLRFHTKYTFRVFGHCSKMTKKFATKEIHECYSWLTSDRKQPRTLLVLR